MYQEHESIFHSNGKNYDLNKVFVITENKRTFQIFLSTVEALVNLDTKNLQDIDWERVNNADLQYPIILSKCNNSFIIVDGYHRFIKTVITGKDLILEKYITPEELETTRICV